ncbi:PIN domain-containing protein [Candidatus Woesearchaeota archaeon]|nr:PIN domain-containing protein [Candidatus Woesearchaeota archaeon]
MIIVVDSNVLFSALVKVSLTRKIIYEMDEDLVFPELIFEELRRNKLDLVKKSKLSEEEFDETLRLILKCVRIIPTVLLLPYKKEAWDLIKEHSPEDVIFVACALAFDNAILWSNDKKLKRQNKVLVLNTREIKAMIKSEGK